MQEMQIPSMGREDPLEKEMATHSSILAWEIPWTEEPGRLQSIGSQKSQTWQSNKTITTLLIYYEPLDQSLLKAKVWMWSMEAISFVLTVQLSLSTVKFLVKFWHSEVQCLHFFSRILIAENWFIKLKTCTDNNLLFFKEGGKMFNCFKSELRGLSKHL